MAHWKDNLPLKVVNVLAFIFLSSSNAYSMLGGHSGATKDTYFSPEQWIFSVWPLIHLMILGMMVYQFFEGGYHPIIEGVGWRFPLLCVLTSVYSGLVVSGNSNHHQKTIHVYAILAFVTMLLIAGVVSHIYRTLKVHHKSKSILDFALVHAPFSLYHGFVVVLVVVSAFNAFGVNAHLHAPKIFTKAFVLAASVLLEATAAGYALTSDGDIMGAGVISFSLLAIFQHQTIAHSGKFIHYSVLVFFIISLVAVLRAVIALIQGRRNGAIALEGNERAPLLG